MDPVDADDVQTDEQADGRDGVPAGTGPGGPLLERDHELAVLDEVTDRLPAGRSAVVAIAGPPGVGKTRLLSVVRERAAAAGAVVLHAAGEELAEARAPFEVARALLGPTLRAADPAHREALLAGAARHAAAVLEEDPEGQDRGSASGGAAVHGLYWYTVALSDSAPLVLIVDDLQWADDPSTRWLLHLVHRLEDLPVLVVVVVRTGEEGSDVLAEVAEAPRCRVLRPAALSADGVAELAGDLLGGTPDEALVDACVEVAAGNPLLTVDLLERVAAAPEHVAGPAAAVRARAVEVFDDRVFATLDRQTAPATALVEAVAVLGEDADAETSALVAGLDGAERDRLAASLVAAGLLSPAQWRCRHPLVRAAVVERMSAADRERGHARAARVLDSLARPLDRVAAHLLAAGPPPDEATVDALAGAGRRAMARGAPAEAERFLRSALEGPTSRRARVGLLTDLGVAERLRSPEEAREHLAEALGLIDSPRERAATVLHLVPLLSGQDAAGLAVLLGEVRDELADAVDGPEDVELVARLRALHLYCSSEHRDHVHRLWTWLDATDPGTLGAGAGSGAQLGVHVYFAAAGLRGDARTLADLARRSLHGEMAQHELFQPISMGVLAILAWAEQEDELAPRYDAVLELARARHWPMVYAFVCGVRSASAFRNGRIPEALADARTASELRRPSLNDEVRMMLAPVAAAPLVELGEVDEAAAMLWAPFPATSENSWRWSWVLEGRARVHAARGERRAALAALRAAGEHLHRFGIVNPAAMPWQGAAALLAHELGEEAEALAAAEEHLRLARRWGTHGHVGAALRVLGVVRGGRAGHELLEQAVADLERSPKALEAARAVVDLGMSHHRLGRVREARAVLRRGLDLADACGSVLLARRARQELVAAGGRPRRNRQSGPEALTPSEADVARFAARGLSNRDIAQALFVTQRTVELHLTNCYRKLHIDGRTQLAGSLDG
ncbi:LuxR family transcriptional regulator [Actinomycetospora sp. NBRC 106378]|uniref:ATP-binding protein n=1 Tax=Actinomycetospora sp. NBRC 106378 TaxID=3032208 RepID=UPI0024A5F1CD|nr:LuxR family transcriptional regulator [Actinomycetospora sp. NBRC 106378]GLZ53123.1 LuxR family transcriptional regulator [Actinomycetospora sp. NBRC 106378]